MEKKVMGLIGVSIAVCLALLIVVPALAVQPVQGQPHGRGFGIQKNGTFALTPAMETKELGFAENLTSTLNTKGADVSGLNAALVNAQSAIQNSNSTAFKDAMKTFNQELQAGIKNGSIPKPGLRQGTYPAIQKNGTFALTPAMETKELGFAENLTSTLNTKGADVSGLNAALVNAQSAIQNSNSTAFKDAMKTFNQELQAQIKSGAIPQSDLPRFSHCPIMGNHPDSSSENHTRGTKTSES